MGQACASLDNQPTARTKQPTLEQWRRAKPTPVELANLGTPFVPNISDALCTQVYDGDSLTIAAYLDDDPEATLWRFKVRLARIDSPELRTKSTDEKKFGLRSKKFLSNQVLGKHIRLDNVQYEKYGRILADVYLGDTCVNDLMVKQKMAVLYNGKKKKTFDRNDYL